MRKHHHLWWVALLGVVGVQAAQVSVNLKDLINQQVKRVIYTNSPILREEYSIVAALNPSTTTAQSSQSVDNYLLVVPPSQSDNLAHISALAEGSATNRPQPLSIAELNIITEGAPLGARYFSISLPQPLTRENPKVAFGVALTYVNRFRVSPSEAPQSAPLHLTTQSLSPYFFSPYHTSSQKTIITVLREFELVSLDCPEPRDLRPVQAPLGGLNVQGANQYACGVYENIPPFHEDPNRLKFTLKSNVVAWIKARRLDRTLELDFLRGLVLVTEDYEFEHIGHQTKEGRFSKMDYLRSFHPGSSGLRGETIPMVPLSIPETAYDVRVRDELGLLHSPQQRRPSPVSRAAHVIEMQPRFPLHGGWSYFQRITYKVPLSSVVTRLVANIEGRPQPCQRLLMPLFDLFQDIPLEELTVRVIVPTDVETFGRFPLMTGVDTLVRSRNVNERPMTLRVGRNREYQITLRNLVKEHQVYMAFHFKVPWWAPYRPFFFSSGLILVALAALVYMTRTSKWNGSSIKDEVREMTKQRHQLIRKAIYNSGDLDENVERLDRLQSRIIRILSRTSSVDGEGNKISIAALVRLYNEQLDKLSLLNDYSEGDRQASQLEELARRVEAIEAKLLL